MFITYLISQINDIPLSLFSTKISRFKGSIVKCFHRFFFDRRAIVTNGNGTRRLVSNPRAHPIEGGGRAIVILA